jgi:hypothetical protein
MAGAPRACQSCSFFDLAPSASRRLDPTAKAKRAMPLWENIARIGKFASVFMKTQTLTRLC